MGLSSIVDSTCMPRRPKTFGEDFVGFSDGVEVGVRTDGSPAGLEEWEVDDVSVAARLLMEGAAVSHVRDHKQVS